MKLWVLKGCIGLVGAFAAYYLFFLSAIFYELYGPSDRFCGTAQAWALQSGAIVFAPAALLSAGGLWLLGKIRLPLGGVFPIVSIVSRVVLLLCALVNVVSFLPLG